LHGMQWRAWNRFCDAANCKQGMIGVGSSVSRRIVIIGEVIARLRAQAVKGLLATLHLMQVRSRDSGVLLSW